MADASARAAELRLELKAWEQQFQDNNSGRKAGRDDIRANREIVAKYKEYNKLRDVLSGKRRPQPPQSPCSKTVSRKLKIAEPPPPPTTPSKRMSGSLMTPSRRTNTADKNGFLQATPHSTMKATPHRLPNFIGPTPQKDGFAMGLFDLLQAETPSKGDRTVLGDVLPNVNVAQTPSKRVTGAGNGDEMEENQLSRTPMSAGKRFFLDKFATPSKRKREDEDDTPTSTAKRHSTTPVFLRRDAVHDIMREDEQTPRPRQLPFKRGGLVRSLSSMIRKAKEQEEERLDDELDMLREMEAEAEGRPHPPKRNIPKILVQDSQAPEMPLGPDQLAESEDEEKPGEAGQTQRVWKKKGQKRQTRRFILRPVHSKPTAPAETTEDLSEAESISNAIADTQRNDDKDPSSGSEYDSDASDVSVSAKQSKKSASSKTTNLTAKPEEGKFKKAVRKVNEAAHANYRRLKIKNKNSKANGRGRFGRRR